MIALYHFLSAAFLLILASALAVGGGILAAMFGAGSKSPLSAMGLGLFVGVLGAAFTMVFAVVAAIAGYGVWTPREWDAFSASCSPASRSFSLFPDCCSWASTSGFFGAGIA